MSVDFTNWIRELCPEIAEWQAELIVEAIDKAVAAEREACARACDELTALIPFNGPLHALQIEAIADCAAAIRARGTKFRRS